MGEKLKELGTITFDDIDFSVELNAGYTKIEKKSIHIQGDTLRYEFPEKHFLQIALLTLRANSELEYIKTHKIKYNDIRLRPSPDTIPNIENFQLLSIFRTLPHLIVETRDNVVTILVKCKPADVKSLMRKNKASQKLHPYCKYYGYKYIYQLQQFMMFKKDKKYYEVIFQLPCLSLTHKTWLPLDKSIQDFAWNNPKILNNKSLINDETYLIYRIANSIFHQYIFTESDIEYLNMNHHLLYIDSVSVMLSLVFFKYTEKLLFLLRNKQYNNIVADYFLFIAY